MNTQQEESSNNQVFHIVIVSAGLSQTSTTTTLAQEVALKTVEYIRQEGRQGQVTLVKLKDLAQDISVASVSHHISKNLRTAMRTVSLADGLVVSTPVFKASYTGLFKSFWDVAEQDIILDKPVVLAATGETERHALTPDFTMRQLFAFLRALVAPTSIMAASGDWRSDSLDNRETRAGRELGAMILSHIEQRILETAGRHSPEASRLPLHSQRARVSIPALISTAP